LVQTDGSVRVIRMRETCEDLLRGIPALP
ncbi:MAG: hypothetical protein RL318_1767, partial [Fibrobacterota bacterium]